MTNPPHTHTHMHIHKLGKLAVDGRCRQMHWLAIKKYWQADRQIDKQSQTVRQKSRSGKQAPDTHTCTHTVTNLPSWENRMTKQPFLPAGKVRMRLLGMRHSWPNSRLQEVKGRESSLCALESQFMLRFKSSYVMAPCSCVCSNKTLWHTSHQH